MCGIAGIFRYRSLAPVSDQVLRVMAEAMVHRGPDDSGYFRSGPVGLAHRRLSIIDLAGGRQPIANEDESLWIVYNGEVYNHLDLRRDLERAGHTYRTRSDTESILHAYEEYGPDCVSRFRGMFAFAIWDAPRRRLFLARDRFGVKPLYYAESGGSLIFASEVKSLLASGEVEPRLREDRIAEQVCMGYLAGEDTLLEGIRKLPAGHTMCVDENGCRVEQYWDFPSRSESRENVPRSSAGLRGRFLGLLDESVRLRLMSDVPLGAFLSGGIDSSAVVGLMARHCGERVKTFSVGYDDPASCELRYARLAAETFGAEYHEIIVSAQDLRDALPRLVWHEDKPIAFPASVSLYFCSLLASRHVKVILTGEGSDELLAGYDRYAISPLNLRLGAVYERTVPAAGRALVRRALAALPDAGGVKRKLGRTFLGRSADIESLYIANFLGYFHGQSLLSVLHPDLTAGRDPTAPYRAIMAQATADGPRDPLEMMQYIDIKTYLEELLMKQDRMSMATSVESRVPFLDHQFAEFAAALPTKMKLRGLTGKRILKETMRGLVPDEIISRKKMGFPVPTARWFRSDLAGWCREVILDGASSRAGFFNRDALETMLDEHAAGRANRADQLWQLLNFALWYDLVYGAAPRAAQAIGAGGAAR